MLNTAAHVKAMLDSDTIVELADVRNVFLHGSIDIDFPVLSKDADEQAGDRLGDRHADVPRRGIVVVEVFFEDLGSLMKDNDAVGVGCGKEGG